MITAWFKSLFISLSLILFTTSSFALNFETGALLVPYASAKLSSQLAAQISTISVKNGDEIKSGQLLISFKCGIEKASLNKSLAEFKAANHQLTSNKKLRELGSSSKLEILLSQAEVEKKQAGVDNAQSRLRMCHIYSPFSGRVVKREVGAYESVTVGQPLLEIIDDHKLNINLLVPSSWLSWLKIDQAFEVSISETGQTYAASVTRINGRIDSVSQTIEVYGQLKKRPAELLAGMSGIARFK